MTIEVQRVSKSFGRARVLDDLSLEIQSQQRVALVGANGAGKTTLIRCLLGQYNYDGEIRIEWKSSDGEDVLSVMKIQDHDRAIRYQGKPWKVDWPNIVIRLKYSLVEVRKKFKKDMALASKSFGSIHYMQTKGARHSTC